MVLKRLLLISCLLIAKALATAPMYENVATISSPNPYGLVITPGGKLYVTDPNDRTLNVFGNLNGALTNAQYTLNDTDSSGPLGLAFGGNDLYIADLNSNKVSVFRDADGLTDFSAPDATISSDAFNGLWHLTIDQNNNLCVLNDHNGPNVSVFPNADTLDGDQTINAPRTLNCGGALNGIAFDGQGKLYTTDWANGNIYVFNSNNLAGLWRRS